MAAEPKICVVCSKPAAFALAVSIHPITAIDIPEHQEIIYFCLEHLADPGAAVGWLFMPNNPDE